MAAKGLMRVGDSVQQGALGSRPCGNQLVNAANLGRFAFLLPFLFTRNEMGSLSRPLGLSSSHSDIFLDSAPSLGHFLVFFSRVLEKKLD